MTFRSQIDEELQVYWMTRDGEQHDVGILEPLGEVMHQSSRGPRLPRPSDAGGEGGRRRDLLGRSTRRASSSRRAAPRSPRSLKHPCHRERPSSKNYYTRPTKNARGPRTSGPACATCTRRIYVKGPARLRVAARRGEQAPRVQDRRRVLRAQIPQIPRVTDGPGYAKMSFTQPLARRADGLVRHQARRSDSMVSSGVLPTRALRHRRDAPRRNPTASSPAATRTTTRYLLIRSTLDEFP